MYIHIGFVPLSAVTPLKAAVDLTFFNLRKSFSVYIYIYIIYRLMVAARSYVFIYYLSPRRKENICLNIIILYYLGDREKNAKTQILYLQ